MAYTEIMLGGVELGESAFDITLARGWDFPEYRIRQLAEMYEQLAALPYVVDLSVTCTSEAGTTEGAAETTEIKGLRILDSYQLDDELCEIVLTTAMKDLHDRICPADANLRWKDGWLWRTRFQTLPDFFEYIAPLVAALEDVLAPDAFAQFFSASSSGDLGYDLPEGETLGGMMLPEAGRRLTSLIGVEPVIGDDGLLRFVRSELIGSRLYVDAYNWLAGAEPSWRLNARTPRGLPNIFRMHYRERHALRWSNRNDDRGTSSNPLPVELQARWVNVYFFDGRYGRLDELLEHFGYGPFDITDAEIGFRIMGVNFEGSAIEAGLSANSEEVIRIIKRDWRQLWRLEYPNALGRMGGWTDITPGLFETRENKDGETVYTGAVTGGGIRMEYTEHLAKVDEGKETQTTMDDGVVFRSILKDSNGNLPVAPFEWRWEEDQVGEVMRIYPKPDSAMQQAVYPGRLTNNNDYMLNVRVRDFVVLDDGSQVDTEPYIYIPKPSDLQFVQGPGQADGEFELEVYAVATRRLPNDATRWTVLERDGFANGDVPVFEPEIAEETPALRDLVDPANGKPAMPDGLGMLLNEDQLDEDADRRARVLRDRLGTLVPGEGIAIGIGPIADLGYPDADVKELRLMVDGPAVLTQVVVGPMDDEAARDNRRRVRESLRKMRMASKEIA